jgi:glutamyl-tRNA(Gln) amidotransferase subunit E
MARTGVPEETRKLLDEGSSAYMRPLPGAARMYPETDVVPVLIDQNAYETIPLPELLTLRAERFSKEFGLDEDLARQVAFSERLALFEQAIAQGCQPNLACRTIVGTFRELARTGSNVGCIADADVLALLHAVEKGRVAKEAVPVVLREVATGKSLDEAIDALILPLSSEELSRIVHRVLEERAGFVREKKMAAFAPLMGVVMKEVRGRVDGKVVGDTLKRALGTFLDE